jgi:hypothetical protein
MTTKQDFITLDAMACILHSAELGIPFKQYMDDVADFGRKRIRMMQKGLQE